MPENNMKWISVEERLPTDGEEVLFFSRSKRIIEIGYYDIYINEDFEKIFHNYRWQKREEDGNCRHHINDVTHWMELINPTYPNFFHKK